MKFAVLLSLLGTANPHGGGAGAACSLEIGRHWAAEASIMRQQHVDRVSRNEYGVIGPLFTKVRKYERTMNTEPWRARVVYRIESGSTVAPYLGAGVRQVGAPRHLRLRLLTDPYLFIPQYWEDFTDRTGTELVAGVAVRLTPRTGIRLDVGRLLRGDSVVYDRRTTGALAMTWRLR